MARETLLQKLKDGFIRGIGWSFGATIGFAIISTLLVILLRSLGGVPLVGTWVADVVQATNQELLQRSPILPKNN